MCGIAGILSLGGAPPARRELRAMADALAHRGPDSEGAYLDDRAGLTMRRLSVIDLETGEQPVANEDRSVWVVFNGEIYNYRDLRRDLAARGHRFRTETDTETIVHLYEEHGAACVEKLRGMFAFAIWDRTAQRLLLARDRLGIKPLYYTEAGGRLAFASELKALLRLPGVDKSLSWRAVGHLLETLTTPADASIVEAVRKLEPGHVLIARPGHPVVTPRYWTFRMAPDRAHRRPWFEERLRELLDESVRLHLVSDVPIGAFLSGGVDSSAVVGSMASMIPRPVDTLSIGFAERGFDESGHARTVAQRFGTRHHEEIVGPDSGRLIEEITWYFDEPFGDTSAIPTYLVSRLAARHVTVVLSGDGGDELFAGYDRYRVERKERRRDLIPRGLRALAGAAARRLPPHARGRAFLRHAALTGAERYLDASALFTREDLARVLTPDALAMLPQDGRRADHEAIGRFTGHWLSALQTYDVNRYLPLDILTKVDRATMAHSVEARVPLLDHKLVEFAATIPPEMNLGAVDSKMVLKRAMQGRLPQETLRRPKRGFAVPLAPWLRGPLRETMRDVLLSKTAASRGILDRSEAERLIAAHERGRDLSLQLWTLLSLEMWCRLFLDRPAVEAPRRPRASRFEPRERVYQAPQPGAA